MSGDFVRRTVSSTIIAGALGALFTMAYLDMGLGTGFLIGVALGALHLHSWRKLGPELLEGRSGPVLFGWIAAKVVGVYAGSAAYLYFWPHHAVPFVIGFSLIFLVMLQKVLGQRLVAAPEVRGS